MVSVAVDLDLDHLRPEARAQAMESDEARIRHIRADRFVPFARAVEGLHLFEELFDYPERTCMPNLLVHADAGMGKTMLAAKFRRDHPSDFDEERGCAVRPIIFVDMPPAPDEGRFFSRLLECIGAPIESRATLARKEALALRILPQLKPRMLMIDEVQHLLSGHYRQQRQALNLIKSLGNQLRVPIVALGTQDALTAIRTDPQMESRFWTFEMSRWREGEELRALLATVQTALPLRRPSTLDERAALKLILAHTGGVTRDIFRLLVRAAELAIRTGRERIDAELLELGAREERRAR